MTDETPFDIDACEDKDALEAWVLTKFGRNIDKRQKLENLKKIAHSLVDGSTQRKEADDAALVAELESRKTRTPKTVRSLSTGHTFDWHPLYKGNADLEIIEWE